LDRSIVFYLLNVEAEWLTFLLRILEVPGSNLGLEAGYKLRQEGQFKKLNGPGLSGLHTK
jgi:hypothetical protein